MGEVIKRKTKNNSSVWVNIRSVLDENKNVVDHFYCCSICLDVMRNDTTSTTPFIRHVRACTNNKNQTTITQLATSSTAPDGNKKTVKISMHHQQNIRDGMVQFVCSDIRPFSAVEGKGIVAAMYSAIELGQANPSLKRSDFRKVRKRTNNRPNKRPNKGTEHRTPNTEGRWGWGVASFIYLF